MPAEHVKSGHQPWCHSCSPALVAVLSSHRRSRAALPPVPGVIGASWRPAPAGCRSFWLRAGGPLLWPRAVRSGGERAASLRHSPQPRRELRGPRLPPVGALGVLPVELATNRSWRCRSATLSMLSGCCPASMSRRVALQCATRRASVECPSPLLTGPATRPGAPSPPELVPVPVNFVGGWVATVSDACLRHAKQVNLALFPRGTSFGREVLWLYAPGGPSYALNHSQANFEVFLTAQGTGRFVSDFPDTARHGLPRWPRTGAARSSPGYLVRHILLVGQ